MTEEVLSYESYGCTMNHGEARAAASMLSGRGYSVLPPVEGKADPRAGTVLVFTCDVISSTERRMHRRIGELLREGKNVFAAGCLASIAPEVLQEVHPGITVMDSMGVSTLSNSLDVYFPSVGGTVVEFIPSGERLDSIVPISTGCLGACTYCITRKARGGIASYSQDKILEMVMKGISKGRREVLLTSQDNGAYGMDRGAKELPILLGRITSTVEEGCRIRVGMMNPVHIMDIIEDLLEAYSDRKVFKFFHIPVQSGSDRLLSAMNRGYFADDFTSMIRRIRDRYPGANISTDVIVGFPGEEEEDVDKTLELLGEVRPDILNITRFSPRPGTEAARMKGRVHGWVVKDRSRKLSQWHREMISNGLEERLGFHKECLVTEIGKKGTLMARDDNYTPIVFKGEPELLGSFMDIRTSEVGSTYLLGAALPASTGRSGPGKI
ncbi:MAG: tRNA (N(6)-L-threonylcarbamoyladenosine(37)-C(2))-methylthiotransferase [Thermoplasmatota archaeon]